jgi:hypothetical protein
MIPSSLKEGPADILSLSGRDNVGNERKLADEYRQITQPLQSCLDLFARPDKQGHILYSNHNWAGMLVERNDWAMYAGLASGMMADMRLIPPHVRHLYAGMYQLLPDDAPSPAETAPHQ